MTETKGVNDNNILLAVEINDQGMMQCRINSNNEAWLALAYRKLGQAMDYYLEEQEIKKQHSVLVKAPASVLERLR